MICKTDFFYVVEVIWTGFWIFHANPQKGFCYDPYETPFRLTSN